MSASPCFDEFTHAVRAHRTHSQAVGITMEERRMSPSAAAQYLRKKAVVLGVSVECIAARTVAPRGHSAL
jgi:hypothetical protein